MTNLHQKKRTSERMIAAVNKLFDIRSGEGRRTGLMFFYIFSIVSLIVIIKSVSTSLFLSTIGVDKLPYVFVLVALFSGSFFSFYGKLQNRLHLSSLIRGTLFFATTIIILIWWGLRQSVTFSWYYYLFYIFVALFGVIATAQFWLLANQIFTAREAKRIFGILGTGAISGGIFGGFFTRLMAPIIKTENLLLIGAGFMLCCAVLETIITRKALPINARIRKKKRRFSSMARPSNNYLKIFSEAPLLLSTLFIIILCVITASLVDYQFSAYATETFSDKNHLAAFIGFWLSFLSIVSLLLQLFVTPKIIRSFGVHIALALNPLLIGIVAVGILIFPGLIAAIASKMTSGSLRNSLSKSGLELLSVPIPDGLKLRAKTFIDVFGDNAATGIGGLLLVLLIGYFKMSTAQLSWIIVILTTVQLLLIFFKVRPEYLRAFRQVVEKKNIRFNPDSFSGNNDTFLKAVLHNDTKYNARQKLFILHLLKKIENAATYTLLLNMIHDNNIEIRIRVIDLLLTYPKINSSQQIGCLIDDRHQKVRIAAMRYLWLIGNKSDTMKRFLSDDRLPMVSAAIMCIINEQHSSEFIPEIKTAVTRIASAITTLDDTEIELKCTFINAVACLRLESHYPALKKMLDDKYHTVRKEAIRKSGETKNGFFIPVLIIRLQDPVLKNEVRKALAFYGVDVLPMLLQKIHDAECSEQIRRECIKTIGMINHQRSVDELFFLIETEKKQFISDILHALSCLNASFANLKFNRDKILALIYEEVKFCHTLQKLQVDSSDENTLNITADTPLRKDAYALLAKITKEKVDQSLEKTLQLLGLLYGTRNMEHTLQGLRSGSSITVANSIEYLDTLLSGTLKRQIVPHVEKYVMMSRSIVPVQNKKDCFMINTTSLGQLLQSTDCWLNTSLIYFCGAFKIHQAKIAIERMADTPDLIVKETIMQSLQRIMTGEKESADAVYY